MWTYAKDSSLREAAARLKFPEVLGKTDVMIRLELAISQ